MLHAKQTQKKCLTIKKHFTKIPHSVHGHFTSHLTVLWLKNVYIYGYQIECLRVCSYFHALFYKENIFQHLIWRKHTIFVILTMPYFIAIK